MPIRSYHYFPPTNFFNTPTHAASPMTIITHPASTLRFVSSFNAQRFQDPRRRLLLHGSFRFKPMATNLEEAAVKGTGDGNKIGGETEELAKEIPPPPEKPEPGDCCGSGCVRCVWDVYYEELEAYNKLYKSDSKGSASISS
ncbi:hypothetical protein HRI_002307600 [Hibiscus trionum]|uniref:Oxidoreductase-like domain-containing protein n=1 Tax=Hibiscus trionum TaxID=183268 RepID=A0A9W7HZQ2_HIBTR|nr:hypothetical protein HRI_002307600 [Hibiscus trionum]